MAVLPISKGRYQTIVDDDMVEFLSQWRWRIVSGYGKFLNLGRYSCIKKAAALYNEAAKKYHGEFAKLNEVA